MLAGAILSGGCNILLGQRAASVTFQPCRLPRFGEEVRCATYQVFEDREAKQGRTIGLRVAVLPASGPAPAPGALFILVGGPGVAATDFAEFYASTFARARRDHDIVLLDQRGTGGSNRLGCAPDLYGRDLRAYFSDSFPAEGVRACREQLAGRADPRLYTTPIAMDDLDEVRAALGYERIDLFGTSYGTRAAMVYLRRYPHHVRSAILKGVMSFDLSPTRDLQRPMEILLDDCAADAACRAAYPRITQEYRSVLNRLGHGPVAVEVTNPETHAPERVELPRAVFLSTLRGLLANVASANQVLSLVHQAAQGQFASLAQMVLTDRRGAASVFSIGMALSVLCSEDAAVIARGAEVGPNGDRLDAACRVWPRGDLPQDYHQPVRAAAPVLIISGRLDPATPPRWAQEAARHLPNSLLVSIRNAAHSYSGLSPCVDHIMADFIARGSVKGLDVSCVEQIRRPPFRAP